MNKTFLILITLFSITTSFSQDISGTWNGRLGIDQERLNIRFNIQKTNNGYTSTCCNNCLVSGKKVISISYENSILKIKFDDLEYEGVYRSDNVIVGELKRAEESFPLELSFIYYVPYENGRIKNMFDEQPISVGSSAYENSKKKMISIQQVTYTSKNKTYAGNNLLNYIVSEKMSGIYNTFYDNDTNSTDTIGKYVNGKRDGLWKKKYRGGSDMNMSEFIYENDKIIKEEEYYYDQYTKGYNKVKEFFYQDGNITKSVFCDTDGIIDYEKIYEKDFILFNHYDTYGARYKGKKLGDLIRTYKKSKLTEKKEGEAFEYDYPGVITRKNFYKNGEILYEYNYFRDGKISSFFDSKKIEEYNSNGIIENYIDLTTNKGFYTHKSGDKFVGNLRVIINENGSKYILPIIEFNGKGEYYWPNGTKYIGDFKKSNFDGYGKMTYPNGSIKEGIWENGNLINDYNKTPIASNSKAKTVVDKKTSKKSKKGSLPAGFYSWSTKEQIEWYNTDEGTAWLMNSQVMKDVAKEILKDSDFGFKDKAIISSGSGKLYTTRTGSNTKGNFVGIFEGGIIYNVNNGIKGNSVGIYEGGKVYTIKGTIYDVRRPSIYKDDCVGVIQGGKIYNNTLKDRCIGIYEGGKIYTVKGNTKDRCVGVYEGSASGAAAAALMLLL